MKPQAIESGRWPQSQDIPSLAVIKKKLKDMTVLIRVGEGRKARLRAIDLKKVDVYETNITNLADVVCLPQEVKGLRVRFPYRAIIPRGQHWAGDFRATIEDIFANIHVDDLPRGTLIEVSTSDVKIADDRELGRVWQPIILVYDRER